MKPLHQLLHDAADDIALLESAIFDSCLNFPKALRIEAVGLTHELNRMVAKANRVAVDYARIVRTREEWKAQADRDRAEGRCLQCRRKSEQRYRYEMDFCSHTCAENWSDWSREAGTL